MAKARSISMSRRTVVAGLALTAAPMTLAGRNDAYAQAQQTKPDKSLYERLGGVFAIAAVIDHFSDAVVENPIVGQRWRIRETSAGRVAHEQPGQAARPQIHAHPVGLQRRRWTVRIHPTRPGSTQVGLGGDPWDLQISPAAFDEVAAELGRTLDFVKVPQREKDEVLAAFAAHKGEVTAGYVAATKRG